VFVVVVGHSMPAAEKFRNHNTLHWLLGGLVAPLFRLKALFSLI